MSSFECGVLMETTYEPPIPSPPWLPLLPRAMIWQQCYAVSQLSGAALWFLQPDAHRHSWADVWCAQGWARLSASMVMLKFLSVIWKCLFSCRGAAAHAVHLETSTQSLGTSLPFLDDIWAAGKQLSDEASGSQEEEKEEVIKILWFFKLLWVWC